MIYKLSREKRKTICIKIAENGDVLVKAPKNCSLETINNFVGLKQKWIIKHQNEIILNNKKYSDFYSFKKTLIMGNVYNVTREGEYLNIGGNQIKRGKTDALCIKKYIKSIAEKYITIRTNEIAKKLEVVYNDIKIISAKKRWGSCDNKKVLKFNYKLIMLDKYLIDYVICHELCHLKEMNHSNKFWKLLDNLGFDKKSIRKQMKDFSFVLNIF